jgi:hypothetical protein
VIGKTVSFSFCKKPVLYGKALFNHGSSHAQVKFICDKLGGELPTFGSDTKARNEMYQQLSEVFLKSASNVTCLVSELANSDQAQDRNIKLSADVTVGITDRDNNVFFWTGITEDLNDSR